MKKAIPARMRKRLMQGRFESGEDIAALRKFVGLTQNEFARAIEISVHTLRNWEQGRRRPEGPAIALLRIAARHPRIIRETLGSAAWGHAPGSAEAQPPAFQGFDIRAAGLLPVQVMIQNDGPYTLVINPVQTFLENAEENLWPVMEKKLASDRAARYADTNAAFREGAHKGFMGAAAGALIGAAVDVVSTTNVGTAAAKGAAVGAAGAAVIGGACAAASGAARREAIDDLRQKELENELVAPGSLV